MGQDYKDISYLIGNQNVLRDIEKIPALPLFSKIVVNFLSRLSEQLMHEPQAKRYSDVIAFAFWIRRASIENAALEYNVFSNRIGWGMAFHIAPSNIPVQFAVTLVYALVAGNASVIRVSDKDFSQVDIICDAVKGLLKDEFQGLQSYICIIRYAHDNEATKMLSEICDIRIIWGGDRTIESIRSNRTQPRCIELGFADRCSIAVIDADEYLESDPKVVARDFYLDTYYSDQNACSSTRLVLWLGRSIDKAKKIFWNSLEKEIRKEYDLNDISGSEKLLRTAVFSAQHPDIKEIRPNNALVRIELQKLYSDVMEYKGNSGYFFEYNLATLDEMVNILSKECQTVTYLGDYLYDQIRQIVVSKGLKGGDRIVPMGHSLDLSFVWDGYDMPLILSRKINNK